MGPWVVPAVFVVAAAATGNYAVQAAHAVIADPSSLHVLLALYAMLRTAIALAFVAFTIARRKPRRRGSDPAAFIACAVAIGAMLIVDRPAHGPASGLLLACDVFAVLSCIWLLKTEVASSRQLNRAETSAMGSFARAPLPSRPPRASSAKTLSDLATETRSRRRDRSREKPESEPEAPFPFVLLLFPALLIVLMYPVIHNFVQVLGTR
jgi:hypothetical protein